jgi:predicted nucleic acid-binding protein
VAYRSVLDANVLFPASLRDLLLRCAEAEYFEPVWTERILAEASDNVVAEKRMSKEAADRLLGVLRRAFPEAMVEPAGVDQLEPQMTNHEKDRHVLATAVIANAEGIITSNIKHFPDTALEPLGKQAIHPDEFLCVAFDRLGPELLRILEQQASDLNNPPHTVSDVLDHLQLGGVSGFAERARSALGLPSRTDDEILAERKRRSAA